MAVTRAGRNPRIRHIRRAYASVVALMLLAALIPAGASAQELPPGWTTTTSTPPTTTTTAPPASTTTTSLPDDWQQVTTTTAPTGTTTTTSTTVPAETSGPLGAVDCAWFLPDMDYEVRNGFQYATSDGAHDDDPAAAVLPCNRPVDDEPLPDVTTAMHVMASPDDLPSKRGVALWAAITAAPGNTAPIDPVWVVRYPDGQIKETVESAAVSPATCSTLGVEWDDAMGAYQPAEDSMFAAAVATGQITSDDFATTYAARCLQGSSTLYTGETALSIYEPCGTYTVETLLEEDGDVLASGTFEAVCFHHVVLDFTSVAWGNLTPGETRQLQGDVSPTSGNRPSVRNAGSGGMSLGILFSPLVLQSDTESATIDRFGASFGTQAWAMQVIDPIKAGKSVWFNSGPGQVVCAGETARLDLWLHAPADLPEGTYRGGITVLSRSAGVNGGFDGTGSLCNNDRGRWGGTLESPASGLTNQR